MMSLSERLRQADRIRRQAMIEVHEGKLMKMLADELTWTHSSGLTENKTQFIAAITSGSVIYQALDIEEDHVRQLGDIAIHHGTLLGQASRAGQIKTLNARFLAVWREFDGQLQMIAWQSTNISS